MRRMNAIRMLACSLLALALLTGCRKQTTNPVRGHAAYYWSTVFRLSPEQRGFIRDHAIERLYVRYFDVVIGQEGEPMPNATIQFKDTFPEGMEVVPTVFILNECMAKEAPGLAHKIAARILQRMTLPMSGRCRLTVTGLGARSSASSRSWIPCAAN